MLVESLLKMLILMKFFRSISASTSGTKSLSTFRILVKNVKIVSLRA